MESFYGGPAGQSFTIKEVFPTYSAMLEDTKKGWNSNIAVGEFVMVSYGIPGGSEEDKTKYKNNLNTDSASGNYNATLYQKEYNESATDIAPAGMSYRLIASLMGPAPNITKVEVKQIGPEEEPIATAEGEYPDDLALSLSLPRVVKFFYGTELGLGQDYTSQKPDEKSSYKDALTGDYFININSGRIYYINKNDGGTFNFSYYACFQPSFNEEAVIQFDINPYTEDGEPTASGSATLKQDENQKWQFSFVLPKAPTFSVNSNLVPERENPAVKTTSANDGVDITFNIPVGTKVFNGKGEPSTENITAIQGDYYLDTQSGELYQYQNNGWVSKGNLQGPTGDPLNIANKDIYTYTEEFSSEKIGAALDTKYLIINDNDLFQVRCNDIDYWFYKKDGKWIYIVLTGGVSSLLQDQYDKDNSIEKAYTVNYINGLLLKERDNKIDLTTKTYTAKYIDGLFLNENDKQGSTTQTYTTSYINGLAKQIAENTGNINTNAESISQNEVGINTALSKLNSISDQLTLISNQLESTWGTY